ncbi:hypothetical protein DFJ74DRAFT_754387 [Hyaloraphidium curvatum]|nr:hypothetical protein DFJ74DRAFT_754387 [Hyaloraphidium curvatum]
MPRPAFSVAADSFPLWEGSAEYRWRLLRYPHEPVEVQRGAGAASRVMPPLHFAASIGDAAAVRELMRYGAEADFCFEHAGHASTPLGEAFSALLATRLQSRLLQDGNDGAAEQRYLAAARALLECGADPESFALPACSCTTCRANLVPQLFPGGVRCLHAAAIAGSPAAAALLLEFGADADRRDPGGKLAAEIFRPAARRAFLAAVMKFRGRPRPEKLCPCASGLPHASCHAERRPEGHPFPDDMLCPCGYRYGQSYGSCCGKRGIKWAQDDVLAVGRVQKIAPLSAELLTAVKEERERELGRPLRPDDRLFSPEVVGEERVARTKALLAEMGCHPAYVHCQAVCDFQWLPGNMHLVDRGDLAKRVGEWNEALEGFLEGRKRAGASMADIEDIRRRFSVSLQLPCGGCRRTEPKPWAFKKCGGCWVRYCSAECQRRDWSSGHKDACLRGKPMTLEVAEAWMREGWAVPPP